MLGEHLASIRSTLSERNRPRRIHDLTEILSGVYRALETQLLIEMYILDIKVCFAFSRTQGKGKP